MTNKDRILRWKRNPSGELFYPKRGSKTPRLINLVKPMIEGLNSTDPVFKNASTGLLFELLRGLEPSRISQPSYPSEIFLVILQFLSRIYEKGGEIYINNFCKHSRNQEEFILYLLECLSYMPISYKLERSMVLKLVNILKKYSKELDLNFVISDGDLFPIQNKTLRILEREEGIDFEKLEGLNAFKDLEIIEIMGCNLVQIPYLGLFQQLKELLLGGNKINTTDPKNSKLYIKTLRVIDLFSNQLEEIPSFIFNQNNLYNLNLGNNKIKTVPQKIGKLETLNFLNLQENKIKNVPDEFSLLRNLRELNLSKNKLNTFSEALIKLESLTNLSIDDNNIQTIPKTIGNLTKLRSLWLNNNPIESIPYSIGNLKNLENLALNFCVELEALPDSLDMLDNLKYIYISGSPRLYDLNIIEKLKQKGVAIW